MTPPHPFALPQLLPHSLVIVSHDRAFLNAVTTHTIHFTGQQLHYYPGSFDAFLRLHAERRATQQNLYEKQEKTRDKLQSTIAALQVRRAHC